MPALSLCFPFPDPATTVLYTLSLHDALPICSGSSWASRGPCSTSPAARSAARCASGGPPHQILDTTDAVADRKSTRLNSSHTVISYAVFCLKKKNSTCNPRDILSNLAVYRQI